MSDQVGKPGRLAVLPEYRRQGLGQLLLDAVETEARLLNFNQLELHAICKHVSFYQKAGYNRVDDIDFDEDGQTHCAMVKHLT